MPRFLRIVARLWLGLVVLSILVGAVGILVFQGFKAFLNVFSPFNIWNYGLIFVLLLPTLLLEKLADKFERRR